MTGNLRFLIQNLLNQLLRYMYIKESSHFGAESTWTLDLNILGRPYNNFFHIWIDFKTNQEIFYRPFLANSPLKNRESKSSVASLVNILE